MAEITIKDIAKKCGVGVSTVSRALNNHPDINPETRSMILRVIEDQRVGGATPASKNGFPAATLEVRFERLYIQTPCLPSSALLT